MKAIQKLSDTLRRIALRTSIIARRRRCVKALRTAASVRGALVRRPSQKQ